MLAVTTSDLDPLPHQIKAVYGELLPRTPLRFLLADDPGAGKTIMAGLYIMELLLRGDLARCLVVAPGSLVEQWQEELLDKFNLRFELLTRSLVDASVDDNVFERHPLLIARMDQLSRSDDLRQRLESSDYDLVVVDEAHRMSAHYYGAELKTTKRYDLGRLLGRVTRHLLLMTATPHAGKEVIRSTSLVPGLHPCPEFGQGRLTRPPVVEVAYVSMSPPRHQFRRQPARASSPPNGIPAPTGGTGPTRARTGLTRPTAS